MAKKQRPDQPRISNRKARHQYHIHETLEAGISLAGTEVKSLRAGQAQITEAYVRIDENKATLHGAQIDRYPQAADRNHDPKRVRTLLLHKRELRKLQMRLQQTGTTLVPLSIYFNSRGLAKVELALVTGKKQHDKRQELQRKTHQREIDRAVSRRR